MEEKKELVGVPKKLQILLNGVLKTEAWSLYNKTHKNPYHVYEDKLPVGFYELIITGDIVDKGLLIASFQLYPMINCCGICVSTRAYVAPKFQGQGIGTIMNQVRIDIARNAGYSLLMCTDVESNIKQRAILKRNGWRDLDSFINRRTNNRVYISVINL